MKRFKHSRWSQTAVQALALALVLSGCGATEETAPIDTTTDPTVAASADFVTKCTSTLYGKMVSINGADYCRYKLNQDYTPYRSVSYRSSIPILTFDDLSAEANTNNYWSQYYPRNWDTNIDTKPGDKMTFEGSGSWGEVTVTSKKILGLITVTSTRIKCKDFTLDGLLYSDVKENRVNPELHEHQEVPMGLMGSDGADLFLIGSKSTHSFVTGGRLRVGFNVPAETVGCAELTVRKFVVERCENSAGATVACP